MKPTTIALIIENNDRISKLKSVLSPETFNVHIFEDLEEFFTILENIDFDIIILDDVFFSNAKESKRFSRLLKTENVILLSPEEEAQNKFSFLENGGWMIAEQSYWKEKLLFYLNQVNTLESTLKPAIYSKNVFVSLLSQNSLHEILFNAFLEKKSIEIFVLGEVKNGRIIIQEGEIISVDFGNSDDFEALIRLLLLQKGLVRVIPFYGTFASYKVLPTLIAMHVESEFQENLIQKWIEDSFQSDLQSARFRWKESKKHVFKSHNEKKLAAFLSEPRSFSQIIELIDEMPIRVLEMLMTLVNEGRVIVTGPKEKEEKVSSLSDDEKKALIINKLELDQDAKTARLLILGLPASGKNEFIALLKGKGAEIKNVHNVEFSKIKITQDFELHLFGMEIDDQVLSVLDFLADKMNGYIFMIDATKVDRFEYTNYLINLFLNNYNVPALVVLSNTSHLAEDAIKSIMKKFQFVKPVPFVNMEITDLAYPWSVIEKMSRYEEEFDSEKGQVND